MWIHYIDSGSDEISHIYFHVISAISHEHRVLSRNHEY